eukprot:6080081-Alexandrium_andersonii.AAC.1
MSASLVGSEMCIRDRKSPRPTHKARVGRVSRGGSVARERGAPHRVRETPVSYTHLTLPTICSV